MLSCSEYRQSVQRCMAAVFGGEFSSAATTAKPAQNKHVCAAKAKSRQQVAAAT